MLAAQPSSRLSHIAKTLSIVLLILFAGLFFFRPIETDDVWWHLGMGKFIVEHRELPHHDPFPFTHETTPWTFTQWAGSCLYYLTFLLGQETSLQILRVLICLATVFLFVGYARRRIPLPLLLSLILILIFGIGTRALLRPVLLNGLFIQILLILLLRYKKTSSWKNLLPIPLLGIVWSNIHLGSFYCGLPLLAIFYFTQYMETHYSHPKTLYLSLAFSLYILSFAVNPYGILALEHPFKVFLSPEYIHFYQFSNIILEMQPPAYLFSAYGIWFWLLLILAIVALCFNRKKLFTQIILLAFATAYFLYSQRNSDLFIIVAAYLIADSVGENSLISTWKEWRFARAIEVIIYAGLLIFLPLQIVHLWNGKIFADGRLQQTLSLKEDFTAPTAALKIFQDNKISGGIFNNDLYGGYILFKDYPNLKPFVDGRQANQNNYAIYVETRRAPEKLWPQAVTAFDFKIALIHCANSANTKFLHYLLQNPDWQLIDLNAQNAIFVKRGAFPLPPELDRFENHLQETTISVDEIRLALQKPTPEEKSVPFLKNLDAFLNPPPTYIDILEKGINVYDLGFKTAGLNYCWKAFTVIDCPQTRRALAWVLQDFEKDKK